MLSQSKGGKGHEEKRDGIISHVFPIRTVIQAGRGPHNRTADENLSPT